ncbi:DUF896 domain-containing protein [Alicyclobacillus sp. ALC3]|uniref:DUF896 domain-containing protein n=1 Tax=Alicyclobacillus sp. ALC3 TaxID=2796143 RepID=UPI0023792601|nr:DUF896 domain-containing protein [Alicyclobacillus sp. ALC3]WDL98648.1 DUF896 domain-containing protein [Alicyclobacillus sp. ALC3]
MLEKKKLNRLNELARKSKVEPLTETELVEQQALRNEYLENFRKGFRDQLDHIHLVDKDWQ